MIGFVGFEASRKVVLIDLLVHFAGFDSRREPLTNLLRLNARQQRVSIFADCEYLFEVERASRSVELELFVRNCRRSKP